MCSLKEANILVEKMTPEQADLQEMKNRVILSSIVRARESLSNHLVGMEGGTEPSKVHLLNDTRPPETRRI